MTTQGMINLIKRDTENKIKSITGVECYVNVVFDTKDDDIEQLKYLLCSYINSQYNDVFVKRKRNQQYVWARMILIQILKKNRPELSLAKIGKYAGGLNHATVIHSINTHNSLWRYDRLYRKFYDKFIDILDTNYPQLNNKNHEQTAIFS